MIVAVSLRLLYLPFLQVLRLALLQVLRLALLLGNPPAETPAGRQGPTSRFHAERLELLGDGRWRVATLSR